MRITTRAVFQMTDDPTEFVELERDSYEHDGLISYAKGGGGSTQTTVTKADPWSGIQPYISNLLPGFEQAAQNVPEFYPGQTYANFDPLQEYAMGGQTGYAMSPMLNQSIGNQFGALDFGLNAVNNPWSNQALAAHADAAIRPLTQAYQEQVLPGIRDQAEMYGGAGSRTGLAEGVAGRGYMDAIASTVAPMYSQAYGQGLEQQARMMALAPTTMQAGMMPWQIMGDVGSQYQNMNQQGINEALARYDYNQSAEYDRMKDYFGMLMGTPWGQSTSEAPNPNQSSQLASALGGGAMGAGVGSMFGAGAGLTGTAALGAMAPWMLGGAALGGLFL